MTNAELLKWQWDGYPRYHQHRVNLLLHVFSLPVFLAGNVLLVAAPLWWSWRALLAGVAGIVISLILEGRGHRLEPVPPEPFTSPGNFVARFFFEHWITFPRFVLAGGWWRNWVASARR